MASVVTGPLAQVFGSDPAAFIANVVSKSPSTFAALCDRLKSRTGMSTWKAPGGSITIDLAPGARANPIQIAIALCGWALKRPADFADEGQRLAFGQPRGLEGNDAFARALGGRHVIDPATISAIAGIVSACLPIILAVAGAALPVLLSMAQSAIPPPPLSGPETDTPKTEKKSDAVPFVLFAGIGAKLAGLW
jgi:hypothetical protein